MVSLWLQNVIRLIFFKARGSDTEDLYSIKELVNAIFSEMDHVLEVGFLVELINVEVACHLVVEGLICEDGDLVITQSFEFSFSVNQGVD